MAFVLAELVEVRDVITIEGVRKRIARLNALALGLSREAATFGKDVSHLRDHELRDYLNSLMDALAGTDAARVVLDQVRKRLEREAR